MTKIMIIGAGIAGLTLGLACQRAGLEVKIYEKAAALKTIGGGIILWPHGYRFLQELSIADGLQSVWMSVKSLNIISHRGSRLCSDDYAEINGLLGGEIIPIDRSLFQQLLASQLQQNTLILNKSCADIQIKNDNAGVKFADGSEDHADLIVGADGIHSAVRSILNPDAKPVYTGYCWWGGIVNHDVVPHFPVNEVQFIMGRSKVCSVWPTHGNRFMWYLPVKMPLEKFNRNDDGYLLAHELCQGWNADVQKIIAADQQGQRFHVPIMELIPERSNFSGRAVLIGDAASAFGPLLGQGANKAIEDAYVLSLLLRQRCDMPALLSRYEELRRARHHRFLELERMSAESLIHETAEALQYFEQEIPKINLVTMFQDMIPLVNAEACEEIAAI